VVSDLSGKEIAIDGKQSASSGNIRAAIVAAGAAEVQVSEDQTQVINRLILAQVPAAVLTLVSPEAAEAFPEITSFRIFRVPLSPRSILVIRAPVTNGSSSASVSPPIKTSSQPIDPGPSDDLDRVIADLDRAIQRSPEDAQAYRDRGNAWGRKGDTDRALADYQQAIRINPNDPAIFHDSGLMWQRKGEFDKAIVDFDRAVRMSFSDPEIYSDRGAAWFEKGSYDRALADFNQALKINPALATAYVRRAGVFERKGDQERARANREQATRLGGLSLTQTDGRSGEVRDH
jgi:tetratricopeptide (TPR) repeat protein